MALHLSCHYTCRQYWWPDLSTWCQPIPPTCPAMAPPSEASSTPTSWAHSSGQRVVPSIKNKKKFWMDKYIQSQNYIDIACIEESRYDILLKSAVFPTSYCFYPIDSWKWQQLCDLLKFREASFYSLQINVYPKLFVINCRIIGRKASVKGGASTNLGIVSWIIIVDHGCIFFQKSEEYKYFLAKARTSNKDFFMGRTVKI